MKKIKKTVISLGLVCSLSFIGIGDFSYAQWDHSAYDQKTIKPIAKGVKHEHIQRFTDEGWVNINVLRTSLEDEDIDLELLFDQSGIHKKAKVSELANQNEQVIGAINADFFSMNSAATIGPMVKEGKLLSTTSYKDKAVPTFNMSNQGDAFIQDWMNPIIEIINENAQFPFEILCFNKESDYENTSILYTPEWGEMTPPLNAKLSGGVEMTIEDDRVKNIAPAGSGTYIPKNGYVVFATGDRANQISNNFLVGDSIKINTQTYPDFKNLDLTVGAGAILVKDGQAQAQFHTNIKGNHPRTALGITQDQKEVMLVTVDGRTESFVGVSQEEMAQIMLSLGAYQAVNFDGGGSTDMVVRTLGDTEKKVINHPSQGTERKIMNGVGVVSKATQTGVIGGLILESDDENMLVNTWKNLKVKGYDTNYYPMELDPEKIKWHVTGIEGTFEGTSFKATSTGSGAIAIEYDGKYESIPVRAIDHPKRLSIYPSKIEIDKNQKQNIVAKIMNEDGYGTKVNIKDLSIQIPNELGYMDEEGNFVASNQGGSGLMKVSFGDLTKYVPMVIGYNERVIDDFEKDNGSFVGYPNEVTGSYIRSKNPKNGSYSGELSYDFTKTDATRGAYWVVGSETTTLDAIPEKIGIWAYGNGKGHALKAKLVDGEGTAKNITLAPEMEWNGWKFVEASIPANMKAPLKIERIYLVETNVLSKDIGKVYLDDLTALYPNDFKGKIPKEKESFKDQREKKVDLKGKDAFRFIASGPLKNHEDPENTLNQQRINGFNQQGEFNVFTGDMDPSLLTQLTHTSMLATKGYDQTVYKNTTFIRLDNTNGGLRKTNFDQWKWLLNQVKSIQTKKLFVILPKSLSFKDPLEEKLFKDTFKELRDEKGTEVWIISGDNQVYSIYPEDGLRYVNLQGTTGDDQMDQLGFPYVLFTVNDDQVTYETKPSIDQ